MKLALLVGIIGLCSLVSCVADPPSPTSTGGADAGSDTGAVSTRKTVFLTRSHSGNLSGGDPDAFCKEEAGGKGEWRAMIARKGITAPASIDALKGDYYEVGGSQPLVTLGVPLDNVRLPAAFDPERGIDGGNVEADPASTEIWIGNVGTSNTALRDRCDDWSTEREPATGITWRPSLDKFNLANPVFCSSKYHVLCFEK